MSELLEGFGIVLGVVAGVVAGTIVAMAVQWVNQKRVERQAVQNLEFGLSLNIDEIDEWLDELAKYRNAVNANALQAYFGYFDLSRFVYVTANQLFISGLLYKYLGRDDIGKLQVITREFSVYGENYLNNQIAQNRANFVQAKAAQDVDFWERKFKEHRAALQGILSKLAP